MSCSPHGRWYGLWIVAPAVGGRAWLVGAARQGTGALRADGEL